jgi:hypothetical protein
LKRHPLIVLLWLPLLAGSALAAAPRDGIYTSAAGQLQTGRFSESWIGGGRGEIGNTMHAQSWDGAALGAQWQVACASISSTPVLIDDAVDEVGYGHRTYRTVYSGGTFQLDGSGAWGTGDPVYGGDIAFYAHTTTYQYANFVLVGYVVNVELAGYFEGYGRCMQLTIANAVSSGNGTQTRSYPVFLNGAEGCAPDPSLTGDWGEVHSITLVILNCNTAVASESWGTIKSLYR